MFLQFQVKLTKKQWERVSEILGNLGILAFASVGFPFVLNNMSLLGIAWGLLAGIILWYYSILSAERS